MKIVMDFRKYDGVVGGVEQGVVQITRYATAHGHPIVLLCKQNRYEEVKTLFQDKENLRIVPLDVSTHMMCRKNVLLDSRTIQDLAVQNGADVIHFPYNWAFPLKKKVSSVLTVHDVIPFTFREAQSLYTNLFKYKPGMKKACALNDVIVTVSEFSRQDISRKVGVPLEKIRVIYNGLREPNRVKKSVASTLKKKYGIGARYILNVGGIHERKNIVRLIKAFAIFVKRTGYAGTLVITGKVSGSPYQEKMKKRCDLAVSETGMNGKVLFTNFITEAELDTLFHEADFFVYPSLYEGFGIPVLEAMKAGLPVLTSNATALPEVAGGAALLTDPEDIEDMAAKMRLLLEDHRIRKDLKAKGPVRTKLFTWEKTAEEYISLYGEISGRIPPK
jgi:glycosyltransferase involved in cell wall biosynthesis